MEESPEYLHEPSAQRPLEDNLKSRSTWLRLFFMIVMSIAYAVTRFVTTVVVIVQFLHVLFTGTVNEKLRVFGQSLATYVFEIVSYLTFNTEIRPFPFDKDWPRPT
jgi:Domain of unknown function (DUF4389)